VRRDTCWFWKINRNQFLRFVIFISSTVEFAGLSSGKAGTIAYGCMQVVYPYLY